ncbi:hypothetical protein PLICRDRAFT_51595 [Plicaturopsis crispa FD-325 SS-3]|nr:hypothetical protein PLICRDRAFT_51595 [Plicaturopsis crispa FD-325 SS-3]
MGNCVSNVDEGSAENANASGKLDCNSFEKEYKILLLGSSESGKSTVAKQMKIIYQSGFTVEERKMFRMTVYNNLLESARAVLLAMDSVGVDFTEPHNKINALSIIDYHIVEDSIDFQFSPAIALAIYELWKDPVIPRIMNHSSGFYLMDSASYFFTEAQRIGAPNYVPNQMDVLRARAKTTGISETRINTGQLLLHIFDVGGQRSQRKQWIHCFESVTSIIFCTALSEYDQVLLEESSQNRMTESLVLFESIINSRWFLRTSIILFLNKIDVFKSKLPKVPLERYFPEYTGGPDINKAAKYVLWRFMSTNRARLNIFPHLIQAINTSNVRLVTTAVNDTISQNALKESRTL